MTESLNEPQKGLLEIKCPFSKQDIPPNVACEDPSFYCFISNDGSLRLKRESETVSTITMSSYSSLCAQIYISGVIFVCTLPW